MRISDDSISKLQLILKKHYKLDYDTEKAQDVGRAVLRLVGLKLQQQLNKERDNEPTNN